MEVVSLEELDQLSAAFDECVAASGDVDRFCSSTDWILPAVDAFGPSRRSWIRRSESGWLALVESEVLDAEGRPVGLSALQPLEAVWGLASPLIGADPQPLARALAVELASTPEYAHHVLLLCGMSRESRRFGAVAHALAPRYELRVGPSTRRYIADLTGGLGGFLSRRTANFRDSMRKARRRARERGVTFEPVVIATSGEALAAYERLLAIERESWKGKEGHGLEASSMADFYRSMVVRLARRNALWLTFARKDGEDLAYILGGTFGDSYRGLQFSFREGHESLSLGNLLQAHEIERLAPAGIQFYDLGTDVEYKKRWGEIEQDSVTMIALPRRGPQPPG